MAKKKAQKSTAAVPMTKKQLSRYQKEKRQERLALGFVIIVVALIALVIAAGFFQEGVAKPNATVAKVNGASITAGAWAKAMVLQTRNLDSQITYWNNQRLSLGSGTDGSQAYLQQIVEQQIQQMQQSRQELIYSVPDQLIANELIRQEAEKRGISVTTRGHGCGHSRHVPAFAAGAGHRHRIHDSDAHGDPGQRLGEELQGVPDDAGRFRFRLSPDCSVPGLQREKLQVVLSETMATSAEQIRVSHIVTDTEDVAKALLDAGSGGRGFRHPGARSIGRHGHGGDRGRPGLVSARKSFPKSIGADVEAAAWALQKGQVVTAPVESYFGYEIIKVTDREANRPLESDKLAQLQNSAAGELAHCPDELAGRGAVYDLGRAAVGAGAGDQGVLRLWPRRSRSPAGAERAPFLHVTGMPRTGWHRLRTCVSPIVMAPPRPGGAWAQAGTILCGESLDRSSCDGR